MPLLLVNWPRKRKKACRKQGVSLVARRIFLPPKLPPRAAIVPCVSHGCSQGPPLRCPRKEKFPLFSLFLARRGKRKRGRLQTCFFAQVYNRSACCVRFFLRLVKTFLSSLCLFQLRYISVTMYDHPISLSYLLSIVPRCNLCDIEMSSWDQYFDHVTFDQTHIQNGIVAADLAEDAPQHINLKSSLQPTKRAVPQPPVYVHAPARYPQQITSL